VAIPSDKNVIQVESEKKRKYKNLSIEFHQIWNMKCFVIPVIIGATGIVTKGLKKYLETIPGKHSIYSLQSAATLSYTFIHILVVINMRVFLRSGLIFFKTVSFLTYICH
jgi:hypothetical protein